MIQHEKRKSAKWRETSSSSWHLIRTKILLLELQALLAMWYVMASAADQMVVDLRVNS